MSTRKKQRTPEQVALIELRARMMNMSQQQFAEYLRVSLPTVGNWESRNPPGGYTLLIPSVDGAQARPSGSRRRI